MNNDFFEHILNSEGESSISVIANFDGTELHVDEPEVEDKEIPILPLRNMMLFPGTLLPVNISRDAAQRLLGEAARRGNPIGVFGQLHEDVEMPDEGDLYRTGVAARVVKVLSLPDGSKTAFLQGFGRVHLLEAHMGDHYLMGHVVRKPETMPSEDDREFRATIEACKEVADKFVGRGDGVRLEGSFRLRDLQSRVFFVNFMCGSVPVSNAEHMTLLETDDLAERALLLLTILNREVQFAQLKHSIQSQTHADLSRQQREYFLRRELENIKDELGEGDGNDIERLRARARKKKWAEEVGKRFEEELTKLERMSQQHPEYGTQYDYLNTLLTLPWDEGSRDDVDVRRARRVLDHDHYGMEKVKERILEHLAVLQLRGDMKSPIICLYGPPGVGKTSLGKSIARAMKRKYVRVSLGGVHDEAEIRGHRRTYIGALPGRIMKGMKEAGVKNPVFVLDEIDKVGMDAVHGDPASALLEVLDPEQNSCFHDNYIDMDYDVSNVMFIATANNIGTIPPALLDRMELIEVSGYLTEEKLEIARRHLVGRQMERLGLKRGDVSLPKATLERIIEDYTRESGVRELEKVIGKVLRKCVLKVVDGTMLTRTSDDADEDIRGPKGQSKALRDNLGPKSEVPVKKPAIKVLPSMLEQLLGVAPFHRDKAQKRASIGVVTGLAWTAVGGEILFIESSLSRGKELKLTLTGNLGDVMKESAVIALEYVKAHADELGISKELLEERNLHIHVPEGAVPKDGPSAGITMATSIASTLTQRPVRSDVAMTGEITLRGKVLPVGGIKEKILAAKRAGIKELVLSRENERNVREIPQMYVEGLTFHYVERVEEVFEIAWSSN